MEHKKAHEPLLRMAKRGTALPGWKAWGIRLIGFLLSLVACALLIVSVVHISPLKVYGTIINAALGDKTSAWVTTRDAMTMLCIAVGLAPAFKMKFWNIGAEGQILVGGIATAACMIYLKALPPVVLILVMMIASLIAGAAWGFLPGFFKARWNTNETLFTLMMNYIAIQLTSFFVAKWEYPFGSNTVGIINPTGKQGWLPNMFSEGYNGDFGWNVLIVLVVTVGMYLYLSKSKHAMRSPSSATARTPPAMPVSASAASMSARCSSPAPSAALRASSLSPARRTPSPPPSPAAAASPPSSWRGSRSSTASSWSSSPSC